MNDDLAYVFITICVPIAFLLFIIKLFETLT